jgi:DNA-binding transcriptional regulator YdaS (Cro superfamily)
MTHNGIMSRFRPGRPGRTDQALKEAFAVDEAIARMGGVCEASRLLGISRQAILNWRHRQVPAARVLQVEDLSMVPRERLRPDLYPSE